MYKYIVIHKARKESDINHILFLVKKLGIEVLEVKDESQSFIVSCSKEKSKELKKLPLILRVFEH